MTEPFVLELLPARGLDQSMLLPVLVGLLVVLLCTETLGWVFAGAVVPGYLASVLVIQPVTGAIVIFESLATLAISAALAKGLSKTDAWTRFFGRDRFFLILVVSLIVRMHDHAWFAPWAVAQLDLVADTRLESQQEFYSVGLVLVPLTANMLWKPAFHRGLMQLAVQVGVTYVLVRYLLLPYTNLSLSSVELTYENAAINFVGHAKAHVILLTAALLAAQFNLTYGWDFNGILVPALLAMLWLTPLKLVATLGEAVIVCYLTKGFLRLPYIRHLDFEGPRKIVLVFALAFVWKVALGFSLAPIFPGLKISDTYGFGYLLSSLLAVKMIGRKTVRGVLLPSLFASAGGFVIGSAIGFMLDLVAPKPLPDERLVEPASSRLVASPLGVMTLARVEVAIHGSEAESPTQAQNGLLKEFWREAAELEFGQGLIARMVAERYGGRRGLETATLAQLGSPLGLQIVELGSYPVGPAPSAGSPDERPRRQWVGVVADEDKRWRGMTTGVVVPGARGPVLAVPMPASEAPVGEAAVLACRRIDCRAVLVAGRELQRQGTRLRPRALELALNAFDDAEIVVLRGDLDAAPRDPDAVGIGELVAPAGQRTPARIHQLRGRLDTTEIWPSYELDWEPVSTVVGMPPGPGSFVVLRTSAAQFEAYVLDHAAELEAPRRLEPHLALEALAEIDQVPAGKRELNNLLTALHEWREPPGTYGEGYRAPSSSELLVLEQLVVEPLLEWADRSGPGEPVPRSVAVRAAELDFRLVEVGDCTSRLGARPGDCTVVMTERARPSTAGWGVLVVRRARDRRSHVIEVPHPYRERDTWRVGLQLWEILEGRALLIAGADQLPRDPVAARDVEADEEGREGLGLAANPDPVRPGSLETPFHAIHQTLDRSAAGSFEVAQIRGLASYRPVSRDIIVGVGLPIDGTKVESACWSMLSPELGGLVARWDSCQVANGSEDLYILSGAGTPQVEYSSELGNAEVRVLWFSAGLRERYAAIRTAAIGRATMVKGLEQAGFPVGELREIATLLAPLFPRDRRPSPSGRPRIELGRAAFDDAVAAAVGYAETGNLHQLRILRELRDSATDLRIRAAVGRDYGQPVMVIEYIGEALGKRALVTLNPGLSGQVAQSSVVLDDVLHLREELLTRPQVLIVTDKPVVELGPAPGPDPGPEEEPG